MYRNYGSVYSSVLRETSQVKQSYHHGLTPQPKRANVMGKPSTAKIPIPE
jgi:hypothetical protein